MNARLDGAGRAREEPPQPVGRVSGAIAAAGAALYIVGDLFDVVGVSPNLYTLDDDAARLEALDTYATAYTVENVLSVVGLVVAAVGLWRLGLALRGRIDERRPRLQAGFVAWAGLATGVWAIDAVTKLVSTPDAIVDGLTNAPAQVVVAGLIYLVAIVAAFVSLALLLLRLRQHRWLAWVLFVGALVGGAVFVVAGPSLTTIVLFVASLTLSIAPPRT